MSLVVRVDAALAEARGVGPLWLEADGAPFPARGWSDFVVVVLGWWSNEVRALLLGPSTRATLRFMDGPHSVTIEARDDGRWEAPQLGCATDPGPLVESVISAGVSILEIARARGWPPSDDLRALEDAIAALTRCIVRA